MAELKACPFCGSNEVRLEAQYPNGPFAGVCQNIQCGAYGPTESNEDEAATAWDRRHVPGYEAPDLPIAPVEIDAAVDRLRVLFAQQDTEAAARWIVELQRLSDAIQNPEPVETFTTT